MKTKMVRCILTLLLFGLVVLPLGCADSGEFIGNEDEPLHVELPEDIYIVGAKGDTGATGPAGPSGNLSGLAGFGILAYDSTTGLTIANSDNIIAALGWTPANVATVVPTANVTTTPTAGLIPAADANKTVDDWISRIVVIKCIADDTALTVATAKANFTIPSEFNGWNIVAVAGSVYTVSSGAGPAFGIYNLTDAQNVCSTNITVDASEYSSYTDAHQAVIDTNYDDVATGDILRLDCNVAGTGTKGMEIKMTLRKP